MTLLSVPIGIRQLCLLIPVYGFNMFCKVFYILFCFQILDSIPGIERIKTEVAVKFICVIPSVD